jgi:hypothetical protein
MGSNESKVKGYGIERLHMPLPPIDTRLKSKKRELVECQFSFL